MTLKVKDGEKIVFIGDSITDCGRRGPSFPLGSGYVKLFADLAVIREPGKRLEVINKGIGGDTAPGLLARWEDDVLWHKPRWISIKIGINDLHLFLKNKDEQFSPKSYAKTYESLLERTRRALPRSQILLIDPFYISRASVFDGFRRAVLDLLPAYVKVVHGLAAKHRARLVRTHEMFENLLKQWDCDVFCPEPVHPNPLGHLAIAEAVYEALSR